MKFIGNWIDRELITPAQGRAIELFILNTFSSLSIWLLDNVDVLLQGWTVDRQAFVIAFATGTAMAITAWLRKRARDLNPDSI